MPFFLPLQNHEGSDPSFGVKAAFPEHEWASLEEPDVRAFALVAARGFLAQFRRSVVLDEVQVQRAAELFSYIQVAVDESDLSGRYVLTGSQNFLRLRSISHSPGRTDASDFFSGIDFWRELAGKPSQPAALIYGGERSVRRRNVAVYSWSSL